MNNLLKKMVNGNNENNNKKKIENLVFLIVILIITIIIINTIWKGDSLKGKNDNTTNTSQGKILAESDDTTINQTELEDRLENILSTIKNVGKVNVLINYSETSSLIPLYNESTTTSSTEEGDSSGGTRNVTQTEVQKDIVFSEKSGNKEPVTQKTAMPEAKGAIVTAEGAGDATVKSNIVNAVGAVTGLSIDKIQVFELEK